MIVEDFYTYAGTINSCMLVINGDGQAENIRRNGFDHGVHHIENLYNDCSTRDARDIDIYYADDESKLVYMQKASFPAKEKDSEKLSHEYTFTFCEKSRKYVTDIIRETIDLHDMSKDDVKITILFVDTFGIDDDELEETVRSWLPATYDFENDEVKYDVVTEPSIAKGWTEDENENMPF
jgi:hypothetical protein